MKSHKLGLIVPYRDRYKQLVYFQKSITNYFKNKKLDYELIYIEQDDGKAFNRGKLLNIGYFYAKKYQCDYLVFHDIDMLPINVDYSYSDIPIHLATNLIDEDGKEKSTFPEYFGGVTMFPIEYFELINGYSNEYWGWGYEDTDLLYRCKLVKIPLDTIKLPMSGGNTAALKFNGKNSYVKLKNIFNFRNKTSILISFYPDELLLTHYKKEDVFAAFGIPGYDCAISFNSYLRYTFQIFTLQKEIIHISSEIKPNHKTVIVVTIDIENRKIEFYQDGELIGEKEFERLYNYRIEDYYYLGCANPDNGDEGKFFMGHINSFAVYSDILKKEEIVELANNKYFGLTQNFGRYKSDYKLISYYDAKFIKGYKLIDLMNTGNDGEIVNCEIVGYDTLDYKMIDAPFRRKSSFQLMHHEENGYVNMGWKHETTRYNQIRFYNEVQKGYVNTKNDGISTCRYTEHGLVKKYNQTRVTVGI